MTKKILNYSVLTGLFLIPFIGFIVPGAMFFPFISGKGFTFRILVEIIFGLWIILAFLDAQYRPKMSWITKSVLFFVVAIFVSDLLSANPYKSFWSNYERMEGFVLIIHLVAYYFVASSVLIKQNWNRLFNATILASVLMSFYGLFQLFGWATINQGGVRVDATFGNSTYFAIYLVFHIFLCLFMFLKEARSWQKWLYGSVALFEIIILYFTATRGAILGFLGGLFIVSLFLAWRERENKTLRKISYGIISGFIILIVGFISLRNTTLVQNSPVLSRFSHLGLSEFQSQGRYFVWPMAIKGFAERPLLGWGQESFNFVFNKYYDPGLYGQEEWFDRTHDIFLDWLIAGGIVGFLAYASMYLTLFYYIWRKNSILQFSEKSVLTAMMVAYIFHNIFVFDNLISYILFFTFLAYVHSISVEKAETNSKFYTKIFRNNISNFIITPIVIILTAMTIYYVNIPAIKANKTLIQAININGLAELEKHLELFKKVFAYNSFGSSEALEQLAQFTSNVFSSQAPDNIKQQFYDFTRGKIEEKVAKTPKDARYLVFAGSFFNRFGQYDQAVKYLERALQESPKKQSIYFELGTSYIGQGNNQKMFELFKQAYELNPQSKESRIIYTIGAIYTKNSAVLKEMATFIDQDTIIFDNRFLTTYVRIGDYNSVINILSARIQKDPNNKQNKLDLASTYVNLGQKQQAIDIISQMIKDDPSFKAEGEGYIKQIQNS
ncbi:MAG: hypothetical protein A3H52_03075 [Candidatus Zambryskibacteria bacterium RIFCSPLOWO2_02_FULL_39_26]|uniref:O-antigen ligase-related domain-containing protein n=1 Tax=Candidatus Zambryskibacteria bacterium RIFCSPLOWO2_12_FULL_39_23 TaxID=1802776 RepID=A0A1G2UTQ2_9BACT|nr:MAG: hypothetical protein A2W51_02950 [Candidatus Zambryskibacteria bacterium RIFCSPHIGHO2_02_39_10]OHA98956.1 MAG: hypothetical protein A3E59_00930 [Candidatus Zambryskibacteria bacterium RIFCSPHIGHO2_12_FULL_39_47]OHB10568.1 MAG: hypothetical protein A3H52_03075 [Candidatus Zambryskibacteria bacterium RIFCSPLOWO2_02_FULL_39_26]OHB12781.1 MAG: hypothetical protein A3G99_01375 [Candidatus Zambryskibacteria bacterium RIFCSPLOWO2_12_FULL_39_23]